MLCSRSCKRSGVIVYSQPASLSIDIHRYVYKLENFGVKVPNNLEVEADRLDAGMRLSAKKTSKFGFDLSIASHCSAQRIHAQRRRMSVLFLGYCSFNDARFRASGRSDLSVSCQEPTQINQVEGRIGPQERRHPFYRCVYGSQFGWLRSETGVKERRNYMDGSCTMHLGRLPINSSDGFPVPLQG